ncbi:MAG: hypothetical protein D3904_07215, partial [Candidatus Electrothrix sp. EH2]|nr:hypothetical protein [Candidatus Electrothrix sp. EH2]
MILAALLTFVLHGALFSWQIQQRSQVLQTKSLPRKITVSLKRLPPPLPPIKKIVQEARTLPEINQVQHQPVRPIPLKPEKRISSAHQTLPKIARVARKPLRPLALQPVKKPKPKPVRTPVHRKSVVRRQPVRQQQPRPVSRPLKTRPAVSSAVRTAAQTGPPVSADVVREAA